MSYQPDIPEPECILVTPESSLPLSIRAGGGAAAALGFLQKSGVWLLILADSVRGFYYEGPLKKTSGIAVCPRPSVQGSTSTKGGATYCPLSFSATQTMANPRAINFAKATTLAAHILDICLAASCLLPRLVPMHL